MGFFKKVDVFLENQRLKRALTTANENYETLKNIERELRCQNYELEYNPERIYAGCSHCAHRLLHKVDGVTEVGCELVQNRFCKDFTRKD